MRILVIEDDRETAQFLQKALKETGHTADLAFVLDDQNAHGDPQLSTIRGYNGPSL